MFIIVASLLLISASLSLSGVLTFWLKMTNIGDSISHSLLFSVVISYFLNIEEVYSIGICAALIVIFLSLSGNDGKIDNTTKLVVLTSIALSTSIILSDYTNGEIRLKDFLMGNVFSLKYKEAITSLIILISNAVFLAFCYRSLILLTISEDIATVRGVNTKLLKLLSRALIIFSIAFSIKMVGVLLISSLLIIPAGISRLISKTPMQMLAASIIISLTSSAFSIILSYIYNISYPPLISLMLCILFYFASVVTKLKSGGLLKP